MPPLEHPWLPRLEELCRRLREAVRETLAAAIEASALDDLSRPTSVGAGDWAFGLDVPTERELDLWLDEQARQGPLSLMTEDSGWRHRGPDGAGGVVALDGFDHGGPRIVVDPIDGTRNLMHDLRPAWTLVSFCEPGPDAPRLADVTVGLIGELPDSRGGAYRVLTAVRGAGCHITERELQGDRTRYARRLSVDDSDRADQGYFPFFRYAPILRAPIADLEATFLARLAEHEAAYTEHCFDDQYCCSAGQLVLTILGRYRMVVEARPLVADWLGVSTRPSKPYDVAGAILCAREAGCLVEHPLGHDLDFELDTETPVSFVAYHNASTGARLRPHLTAALDATRPRWK
ncbi:MAG: inositol monophosphatase family protein [Planctomycetota bacterium]|jgi:fructose-1,6-bisphosphatase/inositol monophosphatase family enzyme